MKTREVDGVLIKGGGFLAFPDGDAKHPGVVVIHELFGLNEDMRNISKRFAEHGYVALAIDLFSARSRAICMARYMTGMLLGSVNRRAGVPELKAALTYLTTLAEVDPNRVGAIGFCMGGTFAIAWACTDTRLKAIAPYYAMNPRPLEAVRRLCPVVGSYPQKDLTANAGRALEATLTKHGIAHDIKVYPGARHSFFNSTVPAYDKAAADDSWARVMTFFDTHLNSGVKATAR